MSVPVTFIDVEMRDERGYYTLIQFDPERTIKFGRVTRGRASIGVSHATIPKGRGPAFPEFFFASFIVTFPWYFTFVVLYITPHDGLPSKGAKVRHRKQFEKGSFGAPVRVGNP